jgi:hypothetical protein
MSQLKISAGDFGTQEAIDELRERCEYCKEAAHKATMAGHTSERTYQRGQYDALVWALAVLKSKNIYYEE